LRKVYRAIAIVSISLQPLPELIRKSQLPFIQATTSRMGYSRCPHAHALRSHPSHSRLVGPGARRRHGISGSDEPNKTTARAEYIVREVGERRNTIREQCIFNSHWQEGTEMNPRVRVNPEEIEQDISSTRRSEGSDARSMTYSAYTIRSVKEQTSQLVWSCNET